MDMNKILEENELLKKENERLKKLLEEYHIDYEKKKYVPQKKIYDEKGALILNSFFKGRKDVYAKRVEGKNGPTIILNAVTFINLFVHVI